MPKKHTDGPIAARIARIGDQFAINGEFQYGEELCNGHINTTYRACYLTEDGIQERYILQRINDYVFKDPVKNDAKIDWSKVIFNGLIIKGIYGRQMHETWYKMSAMLQGGLDISNIITHRMDVKDYEAGFEAMNSGKSGKVILDWSNI